MFLVNLALADDNKRAEQWSINVGDDDVLDKEDSPDGAVEEENMRDPLVELIEPNQKIQPEGEPKQEEQEEIEDDNSKSASAAVKTKQAKADYTADAK